MAGVATRVREKQNSRPLEPKVVWVHRGRPVKTFASPSPPRPLVSLLCSSLYVNNAQLMSFQVKCCLKTVSSLAGGEIFEAHDTLLHNTCVLRALVPPSTGGHPFQAAVRGGGGSGSGRGGRNIGKAGQEPEKQGVAGTVAN